MFPHLRDCFAVVYGNWYNESISMSDGEMIFFGEPYENVLSQMEEF